MDYTKIKLKNENGDLLDKIYENDRIFNAEWTPNGISVRYGSDENNTKEVTCNNIIFYS